LLPELGAVTSPDDGNQFKQSRLSNAFFQDLNLVPAWRQLGADMTDTFKQIISIAEDCPPADINLYEEKR